jgi:hypothetical protein
MGLFHISFLGDDVLEHNSRDDDVDIDEDDPSDGGIIHE